MQSKHLVYLVALMAVLALGVSAFLTSRNAQAIVLCKDAENSAQCYAEGIESILKTRGLNAALDALALAYEADPLFAGECHANTHEIGRAAYHEFRKNGKVELSLKASYCGYGFYHGFLEELLGVSNDLDEAREFCSYAGRVAPNPPGQAEGSCYHGIGHGVTDGYDPRLWGNAMAQVRPGLAMCEKVSPNDMARGRCASGVFNSLANMYYASATRDKFDAGNDPYALCKTGDFNPIERNECYSQMNTLAAYLAKDRFPEIVAYTNSISDERHRGIALKEAASYYVQQLKRAQKEVSEADTAVCERLPSGVVRDACIHGLVAGIFEFGTPAEQHEEALRLCELPGLSEELKRSCFAFTLEIARWYVGGDIRRICGSVPVTYRTDICEN